VRSREKQLLKGIFKHVKLTNLSRITTCIITDHDLQIENDIGWSVVYESSLQRQWNLSL
jgi:hypothetical protein